jgi:predicted nucleic acid-binding protein
MIHGVDADFLVAVEVKGHVFHQEANRLLDALLNESHTFALAPQTLAEFIHVVTDAKRLPIPLTITEALERAERWWEAIEVMRVFPDGTAVTDFFSMIRQHRLGRKRLLDTMLAATLHQLGIRKIITNNEADYRVLATLEIVSYRV